MTTPLETPVPGFIRPSSRSIICAAPCGRTQVAELDPRYLASGENHVEPHHFAGLEVDERGIIQLLCAADVGSAKADDAAGKAENSKRDTPARRDLVLAMQKQRVIVAGLLPETHGVLPEVQSRPLPRLVGR